MSGQNIVITVQDALAFLQSREYTCFTGNVSEAFYRHINATSPHCNTSAFSQAHMDQLLSVASSCNYTCVYHMDDFANKSTVAWSYDAAEVNTAIKSCWVVFIGFIVVRIITLLFP